MKTKLKSQIVNSETPDRKSVKVAPTIMMKLLNGFKKFLRFLKKRWWVVLLLIIIGFIIYGQTAGKKSDVKELSYKVKRQTLQESLSFSGAVDAQEKATLRFQTSGRLSWVGVKEGDVVRKYQAIASLDQQQLKKQLQKELNAYDMERIDFDNEALDTGEHALPGDKYLRQDTVDAFKKAQFDLNSSVLDVELSDIALRYSTLVSPIDGVVVSVGTKQAGVNVTPTQAEFVIVNPSTLYFSGAVDQTDVVKMHEEMSGMITFDSYPDDDVVASVSSIAFVPKEDETGTVNEVKIAMGNGSTPETNVKYRLGMTGDVEFITKDIQDVLGVPTTFIKTERGKHYVFKKDGDKKIKAYVEVGEEIDIATVILDGLVEGDVVYD